MAATSTHSTRRWVLVMVLVLVLIGLALALRQGSRRLAEAPVWQPRPVPVRALPVGTGKLQRGIRYLARLEPIAIAQIAPQVSARVEAVMVRENDPVTPGQPLAKLDDRDFRAQIDSLKAKIEAQKARLAATQTGLEAARKTAAFLHRELARDQTLFEQKGISASALEVSRNNRDTALGKQLSLEQEARGAAREQEALGAQLEEAQTRLSYTEIRAPMAGIISGRYVDPGDMAKPGSPLFSLLDRSSHRLAFDLVQEDLALVRAGQEVLIQWPGTTAAEPHASRITRIFPALEKQTTVRAEVDLFCPCPGPFRIGTMVPIEVVVEQAEGLIIPRDALVPLPGGGFAVYAVRDGKIEMVPVTVRLSNEVSSLVEGDLSASDRVAVGEYLQWVRHHQGQAVETLQ